MSRRVSLCSAGVAAVLLVSGACTPAKGAGGAPSGPPTTLRPTTTVEPAIYGSVQTLDQAGDGHELVVSRVELRGIAGFVVIHDEDQGGPDNVIGYAPVPMGTSTNVVVTLDHAAVSGAYWAMLHRDVGQSGLFEWPGPDGPVRAATGIRYAQKRLVLTVDP